MILLFDVAPPGFLGSCDLFPGACAPGYMPSALWALRNSSDVSALARFFTPAI
jgi:hypothetical protein